MTDAPDHATHDRRGHFLLLAVLGNMAGGLGLVTVLRLLRSKERLADERQSRT